MLKMNNTEEMDMFQKVAISQTESGRNRNYEHYAC